MDLLPNAAAGGPILVPDKKCRFTFRIEFQVEVENHNLSRHFISSSTKCFLFTNHSQGSAPSTKDKRLWGPTVPFLTSVCAPKGYCPVSSRESFLDSWPKILPDNENANLETFRRPLIIPGNSSHCDKVNSPTEVLQAFGRYRISNMCLSHA